MKKTILASLALATAIGIEAQASGRTASLALEDAAFQTAMRMEGDVRVGEGIRRVAFVRLWTPKADGSSFDAGGSDSVTFEAALGAVPCRFDFVLHSSRDEQWKLIDEVFDQAEDFDSYDPETHPELKRLQLCDALLLAKLIDAQDEGDGGACSVRVAAKLVETATARTVWSAVLEGRFDPPGPSDGELNPQARAAMEEAAEKLVAKLPDTREGYEVYVMGIDGAGGRAMSQLLFSAVTRAGRQDRLRLHDLPQGTAEDRMTARYLRECTGTGTAVDSSVFRGLEARGLKGGEGRKVALLSGTVGIGRVYPATVVDPTGKTLDLLTGSLTEARGNPTLFEVNADVKIRDAGDGFRVLAAASETGTWRRDVPGDFMDQLKALATVRNAALGIGAIIALCLLIGLFRAIVRQASHIR